MGTILLQTTTGWLRGVYVQECSLSKGSFSAELAEREEFWWNAFLAGAVSSTKALKEEWPSLTQN